MKYLDKLRADPRVAEISDERGGDPEGGDGIWIYLKDGFDSNGDPWIVSTCIHEWNLTDLRAAMTAVTPVDPTKHRE
jgi:hypothetical protein